MAEVRRSEWLGRRATWLALGCVVGLVLVVRALGFEHVFQAGRVVFQPADAQYHLRLAFHAWVEFPAVLVFDPYLNYPGGAPVPWPPLFDLLVAGIARLLAGDRHGFELVAAWMPPVLAAATAIPVYLAGRRVASRGVGLAAGALLACLPIHAAYTALGNPDHHAAVGAIGAWLLCVCMALVDPGASVRRLRILGVGLATARTALIWTWPGSLLYLALAEAVLLGAALRTGSRALPRIQSVSALATAAATAPVVALWGEPLGGPYSALALSWLHVLAMVVVAGVAGWLACFDVLRPGRRGSQRAVWLLGGAAVGGVIFLLPGPRAGLDEALRFLTLADAGGLATSEQRSLFAIFGRNAEPHPARLWGAFAYLLPLAPLGPWLQARRASVAPAARAAAWVLLVWTVALAALSISQIRYGSDAAPAASLAFVLLLLVPARRVTEWIALPHARRVAVCAALLAGALLLSPAVHHVFWPRALGSLATLRGDRSQAARAATSVEATLTRFVNEVRVVTPETSSYLADGPEPEYGIVAHPNLGHDIVYGARRPTGAGPFQSRIGERNWALMSAFQNARSEREALAAARGLRARYAITLPTRDRGDVPAQLHYFDGAAQGLRPRLEHFRLITESARPGRSILARRRPDPPGTTPYKLFEIVPGAVLEVRAPEGERVGASVSLRTPAGREFVHNAQTRADADGIARLRLPYPTDGGAPVHARGPYRVRVGGESYALEISEAAVRHGEEIRLSAAPTSR